MMKTQNKKNAKPQTIPVRKVIINVMADGTVNVARFPNHFDTAMDIMDAARNAVVIEFIKAARDNRLSDDMLIGDGNILMPDKSLIVP